jgi:hypothetical protein
LGRPVEPEVNRNLATVAGPIVSRAAATAGVGSVPATWANGIAPSPVPSTVITVSVGSMAFKVASALANWAPLWVKTTRGATLSKPCFSLAWSVEIRL